MVFICKVSKGHNSSKHEVGSSVLSSAHFLVIFVSSFKKLFLTFLKLLHRHDFHTKNSKGHNFSKKHRWNYNSCTLHIV